MVVADVIDKMALKYTYGPRHTISQHIKSFTSAPSIRDRENVHKSLKLLSLPLFSFL